MEEIINQIIENRNYNMLSDKQVEALKRLLYENKTLKNFTATIFNEKDEEISKGEE
mgnify:CR=1 FL=1